MSQNKEHISVWLKKLRPHQNTNRYLEQKNQTDQRTVRDQHLWKYEKQPEY